MPIYTFGPFALDVESRTLTREGESISIAGKTLDTLLALVQNRGRVVDKDELLSLVWPGFVVEEANLSQSIFAVRKVLGDSPKDHRYIATISGRGYQFVAPVLEDPSGRQPIQKRPAANVPTWRSVRVLLFGATVSLILVLITMAFWRPQAPVNWQQSRRFTSLPGVETMPAFSPDGRQLAYVHSEHGPVDLHLLRRQMTQANIYAKLIEAGTEIRLTNHPGADYNPAWSPNGEYVAFYRDSIQGSGYYIVSALGGLERRITHEQAQSAGIVWSPEGHHLVVAQLFEGSRASSLLEISVETGQRQRLTFPPAQTLGDAWPAFSPDGKLLAFARIKNSLAFDLCIMRPHEQGSLHCVPMNASLPDGLAWTAAGDALVGSSMVAMAPRLWRYDLKRATLSFLTSGEEVSQNPAVSRQGSLAYVISTRNVNLWRLDVGSFHGRKPPDTEQITHSTSVQSDPSFSPDARKIAFVSVRSGVPEIWITEIDSQRSTQLTHIGGMGAGSPSWSPDGLQIAFDAADKSGSHIYLIAADGGSARRITSDPGENVVPSWSQDGKFIFFSSNRSGDFQIWKCRGETGETQSNPASQITSGGGFRAFESVDHSYLYYAKGRGTTGLWRRSLLHSGSEECVLNTLQEWGWWALGPEIIYFLDTAHIPDAPAQLKTLDIKTGRVDELFKLPLPVLAATPALAISRDARYLAYSQINPTEADIMLRENSK